MTRTVTKTVTLSPGTFTNPSKIELTVPCPSSFTLAGASYRAATDLGQGVVSVARSAWTSSAYHVLLDNSGKDAQQVTVTIVCGKLVSAKPRRSVQLPAPTVVTGMVPLPAATTAEASAACPAGTFPSFGGYQGTGRVRADTSHPNDRGWFWSLFWDDPLPSAKKQTQTVCQRQRVGLPAAAKGAKKTPAKTVPARLRSSISRELVELDATGPTRVTASCKPGELAVGGGHSLVSGLAGFQGTQLAKRSYSAFYSLDDLAGSPPEVAVMAVCVAARLG